jgi:hypothetical protein
MKHLTAGAAVAGLFLLAAFFVLLVANVFANIFGWEIAFGVMGLAGGVMVVVAIIDWKTEE